MNPVALKLEEAATGGVHGMFKEVAIFCYL